MPLSVKYIQNLASFSLLTVIVLSCSARNSPATTPAGPISGGGGGMLPPSAVSYEDYKDALENSLLEVRGMLYGFQKSFDGLDPANSIAVALFDKPENVFTALPLLTINLEESAPCYDRDGSESDASVQSVSKKQICISFARLKNRLDEWTYRPQLSALLTHEISHLVNADEEQANALQNFVLEKFIHLYTIRSMDNPLRHAAEYMDVRVGYVTSHMSGSLDNPATYSGPLAHTQSVCSSVETLGDKMNDFVENSLWMYLRNFALFQVSPPVLQHMRERAIQMEAIHDYFCSNPTFAKPSDLNLDLAETYASAFAANNTIGAVDYRAHSNGKFPSELTLTKFTSPLDVVPLVREIENDLADFQRKWKKPEETKFNVIAKDAI
jgi:hypothetical protein